MIAKWLKYCSALALLTVIMCYVLNGDDWLYQVDRSVFWFFNDLLRDSYALQIVAAIFNHRYESIAVPIVMFFANLYLAIQSRRATRRGGREVSYSPIIMVICGLLAIQLGVSTMNKIFSNYLHVLRLSPSVVEDNVFSISATWQNNAIKDRAVFSFPSGHAFAATIWAMLNLKLLRRWSIWSVVSLLLCFPRVIVGGHWLSDVLFAMTLAWLYYEMLFLLAGIVGRIVHRKENIS